MARKFKSAATSRRFKNIAQSLQASRGEIEKKTRADVQAAELAKRQHKEESTNYIAGMSNSLSFEGDMLRETQKMEDDVRKTQYSALVKRADTHVKKLEDEARQKQDYANFLSELAPKRAKMFTKLAEGGLAVADSWRGIEEWKALKESGFLNQITDGKAEQHYIIAWDAQKSAWVLSNEGDVAGSDQIQSSSIRISSHFAQQKFLNWVKNNKERLRTDAYENFTKARGIQGQEDYKYGESNAVQVQELAAHGLLEKLGLSSTTKTGAAIIDEFTKMGSLDAAGFYKSRKFTETDAKVKEDLAIYLGAETVEEQNLAFNNLVLTFKNGWFKDNGRIVDPTKGGGLYFNTADAGIQTMKYIIDNDEEGKINPDNIYETFEKMLTPITDQKSAVEAQTWVTRHRKKFDDVIVPYVTNKFIKKNTADEKTREANGNRRFLQRSTERAYP